MTTPENIRLESILSYFGDVFLGNVPVNSTFMYSRNDREIAIKSIKNWCKSEIIDPIIVSHVIRMTNISITKSIPTVDQLTHYLCDTYCECIMILSREKQHKLIRHFLVNFGRTPACNETKLSIEYEIFHQQFPTQDELINMMTRMLQLQRDPEAFHMTDKLRIPTSNLNNLKAIPTKEKGIYCALCQEEMESTHNCYTLTPCGHKFHSDSNQCLGNDSIITWLSSNKTCPICKAEIIIPKNIPKITSKLIDKSKDEKKDT